MTPRILIIAGSDSGGGAGIQADIKTVTMLGGHAMTAITAITAQNTLGVQAAMAVPTDMVMAQIASCVDDIGVDAVKIGMLGSAETALAVAEWLESSFPCEGGDPAFAEEPGNGTVGRRVPVVFDPVMVATSGAALADGDTTAVFDRLVRSSTIVTPNTDELAVLAGFDITDDMLEGFAAEAVLERTGGRSLLAKGGHLPVYGQTYVGTEKGWKYRHENSTQVYDSLFQAQPNEDGIITWNSPRIDTRHTHGTGCTLASAIAVGLAEGLTLHLAICRARDFVHAAILAAPGFGPGHGPLGQQAVRLDPISGCG